MLVLARCRNEAVLIRLPSGESITVKLLEIDGSQVKLGFEAPKEIRIARAEIAGTDRDRPAQKLERCERCKNVMIQGKKCMYC